MKKIYVLLMLSLTIFTSMTFPYKQKQNNFDFKLIESQFLGHKNSLIKNLATKPSIKNENLPIEKATNEEMLQLIREDISNIPVGLSKKDWYIEYKLVFEKYPDLDKPKNTIYDVFNEDELDLLFRVVQAEVGDEYSFDEKTNVASVIFNRYYSRKDKNISNVLFANNQFATITNGRYKKVEVDENTILACEYAFQIGDTTQGAMFFDSTKGKSWATRNKTYIFTDSAGHDFYK